MPASQSPSLRKCEQGHAPGDCQAHISAPDGAKNDLSERELYWMIQWRRPQYKKHKTWDGDGILVVRGVKAVLYDQSGKIISCGNAPRELSQENVFFIGDKEVGFDRCLTPEEYTSAACYTKNDGATDHSSLTAAGRTMGSRKAFVALTITAQENTRVGTMEEVEVKEPFEPAISKNQESSILVKKPTEKQSTFAHNRRKQAKPLHDPLAPGAIVMKAPCRRPKGLAAGSSPVIVPVVLDPIITRKMRPHQIEGVKFMYESVMELRKHEGQGCILADDMGLGKSFQTIALIWTLLKQNPYPDLGPAAKKVLLVCPVTLVNNWKAEFYKWLGRDRVNLAVCNKDIQVAQTFANSKAQHVLIIGYERLRTVIKHISLSVPPIDLIVCDEGHRLKSSSSKTREVFAAFRTPRKIVLSGTPIQNDLREFHAMTSFCNPGLLDDYTTFRRLYEIPIVRGRAIDATPTEVEIGRQRSAQLNMVARSFVLRRDISILRGSLPPKFEYILFVTPTSLQLALYMKLLQPEKIDDLVRSPQHETLALIGMLVKISNSPILLKATVDSSRTSIEHSSRPVGDDLPQLLTLLPREADVADVSLSGKLIVLSKLLRLLYQETDEKCVIVSHYTSTLNILEVYCKRIGYSFLRLDGQTPPPKRQGLVTKFNGTSQKTCFIFLLSSKAGGVGINLIGASRLCLFDCDWNPSHDAQAMARCHRDGQTRPVFVYRLLTTGTIDEKIFQRQVTKLGLSSSLIGDNAPSKGDSFSRNDLRDIFRIHPATACNTHDLLQCPCNGSVIAEFELGAERISSHEQYRPSGFVAASQAQVETKATDQGLSLTVLSGWKHFDCSHSGTEVSPRDEILVTLLDEQQTKECPRGGNISYIFEKTVTEGEGNCQPEYDSKLPAYIDLDTPPLISV